MFTRTLMFAVVTDERLMSTFIGQRQIQSNDTKPHNTR